MPLVPLLVLFGLAADCAPVARPGPEPGTGARLQSPPATASRIALPLDGGRRFLQSTAPLPLPPDALTVHLELGALRRDAVSRRVLSGVWAGLRADSIAAGQLLPYLRRCGVKPRRELRAITLSQPLDTRPDVERVVIFWGLIMAQRVVTCLEAAMEGDGARIALLSAGGEPAFSADRPASNLHLDAMALDAETLLVASGRGYRAAVRRMIRGTGRRTLAAGGLYQRAVRAAPRGTLLLAVAPRLPRRAPHFFMPEAVRASLRGSAFTLSRERTRGQGQRQPALQLTGDLEVTGRGRAARWAKKLSGRARRLAPLLPRDQRPLLGRARAVGGRGRLVLRLALQTDDLGPLGRLVTRWLPW